MKQQLYEENNADKHLVVGSIEILGDLKNDGIATIRQNISAIQQQNSAFAMDQQTAWQNLADDGVITPVEKKTVYREYQNILKSYSALELQAINKNLQNEKFFRDYIATYTELKNYLNVTLKLFDDMESNTTLTETQQKSFDTYFANYYGSEKYTTLALSYGAMGSLGFTVLTSLNDPGTEGEVGLYRGQIYQYVTDHWEAVGLEGYIGVAEALPTGASLNQYFLVVAENGFTAFEPLLINGEVLIVNDNKQIFLDKFYEYSYIYLNAGDHWQKVSDKTDYRYVVAMTDLVNYTGQLPGVYQKAIDDAIEGVKKDIKQPTYYGVRSTAPANPNDGDFFVYSGTSTSSYTYAHVLRWSKSQNKWEDLSPDSNVYSNYYMQALEGILSITNPGEGYFTTIFARSFFSHSATMEALAANTIKLNGTAAKIVSGNPEYSPKKQGLLIDASGNIDANANVYIGGDTTIKGSIEIAGSGTIGSGVTIKGSMDAASGLMKDLTITGNSSFSGTIDSGPLLLENKSPAPKTIDLTANTDYSVDYLKANICNVTCTGTWKGYSFDYVTYTTSGKPGNIYSNYYQYFKFYKNGSLVGYEEQYNRVDYSVFRIKNAVHFETVIPSGSKTFKLRDLPVGEPAETGIIYRLAGENILRIKI